MFISPVSAPLRNCTISIFQSWSIALKTVPKADDVLNLPNPVIDCIFTNLRMSNLNLPPVIQPELDKVITALAKIKY